MQSPKASAPAIRKRRISRGGLSVLRTALAGVFILVLMSPPTGHQLARASSPSGFVTRNGQSLQLNGRPYKFTGLNVYNANSRGNCWYDMQSGSALESAFTGIGFGKTAIRAWFFQPFATRNGLRDWTAFDRTLAKAEQHGFKVIAVLGDQWGGCERSGYKSEDWYANGYRTLAGSEAGNPQSYRDYVAAVVSRYRSNPAILAWQLMNEAEARVARAGSCPATATATLRRFADDMGSLVKTQDPNHLLSFGTIGTGQCGTANKGYKTLHASSAIDLCEMHDYAPTQNVFGDRYNGMQVRLDQCRALNKPLFIGEAGIANNTVNGGLTGRARRFDEKLAAQFTAGAVGFVVWHWRNSNIAAYDYYSVSTGDPVLDVLARYDTADPAP